MLSIPPALVDPVKHSTDTHIYTIPVVPADTYRNLLAVTELTAPR